MKKFVCKMTSEEVANLLLEGKVIKKLCDDNEYKLIKGLLYDSDNNCFNSQLFLEDEDLYFEIEEETIKEPFEIKDAGLYKLRNGKKAFVNCLFDREVSGVLEKIYDDFVWNIDGTIKTDISYYTENKTEFDIISKWND